MQKNNYKEHPLFLLYTGDGKGKTTAAMGLLFRTLGHGGEVAVIQYIKPSSLQTGEKTMAKKLGVLWENYGSGFLWEKEDETERQQLFDRAWERTKELVLSETYDLIILDEITYLLNQHYINESDFLSFFSQFKLKERKTHIVFTGRGASEPFIELCDLVSSVQKVKHPFKSEQIDSQVMIEF